MIVAFFCLLGVIGLFLFLFIFWPFFIPQRSGTGIMQIEGFNDYHLYLQEKEMLLDNLKEVELDLQMEKLDSEDYKNIRATLVQKLGAVMQKLREIETQNQFLKNVQKDLMKVES